MIKAKKIVLLFTLMLLVSNNVSANHPNSEEKEFSATEMINDHIGDSHLSVFWQEQLSFYRYQLSYGLIMV